MKNNKKTFFSIILLLLGFNLFSQQLSYEITSNDPDEYKRTRLTLYPFCAETYLGADLSYALKFETQVGKFVPQVKYSRAYLEFFGRGSKTRSTIDIGACFNFHEANVKEDVHVTLSSNSYVANGVKYTSEKFINIPAEIKNISGLYLGFFNWKIPMIIENGKDILNGDGAEGISPFYHYETADGLINVPIHETYYSGTDPQPLLDQVMPNTMEYLSGVKFGFHSRKITNLTVSVNNWGLRKIQTIKDFSFDLIYAFNIDMDGFTDKAGTEWKYVPATKKMTRHLGWQVTYAAQWKVFGWYWDFGWKPAQKIQKKGLKSIMDNGFNLDVGISFAIGSKKSF